MSFRYLKQPNGKLACFSDIVDDFTIYNMTEEQALEDARKDMGEDAARAKIDRALRDEPPPWSQDTATDGLRRWRDALEMIAGVHGDARRDERERMLSR